MFVCVHVWGVDNMSVVLLYYVDGFTLLLKDTMIRPSQFYFIMWLGLILNYFFYFITISILETGVYGGVVFVCVSADVFNNQRII